MPTESIFPVSDKVAGGIDRKTSKMMKLDLEAARAAWLEESKTDEERQERERSDFLKYKDSQNRFADFHANRHTFITNLSRAGVAPKVAQELARHSDIRLTMGIYTHTDLAEKKRAIQSLPKPWEYIGSKPEALNGVNCPKASFEASEQVSQEPEGESTQVVDAAELDATCREESQKKASTPTRVRTWNLRFRRPMLYPIELWVRVRVYRH